MPGTKIDTHDGTPFDFHSIMEQLREVKIPGDALMGFTRAELQRALGLQQARAGNVLKDLVDLGFAELVGRRHQVAIDGTMRLVPVYRFTEKTKKS